MHFLAKFGACEMCKKKSVLAPRAANNSESDWIMRGIFLPTGKRKWHESFFFFLLSSLYLIVVFLLLSRGRQLNRSNVNNFAEVKWEVPPTKYDFPFIHSPTLQGRSIHETNETTQFSGTDKSRNVNRDKRKAISNRGRRCAKKKGCHPVNSFSFL